MPINTWSTTTANNGTSPNVVPFGWPEGMLANQVNDTARQNMADIRAWYESGGWCDFGTTIGTPVYVSATSFKVTGDKRSFFTQWRTLRLTGSGAMGVQPCLVFSSSFAAGETTVQTYLTFNTATTLDASLNKVELGFCESSAIGIDESDLQMRRTYNALLAPATSVDLQGAIGFANTSFVVNCWVGGSNVNDGMALFGTGFNGATVPLMATGICNVSNGHNWASPPANQLVIGRELTGNKISFYNSTAFTINLTIRQF